MTDILARNNVRIIGDAKEAMVLAHGFGCDQNVWRHFIKAFKPHYKLVLFDYVGAGQSDLTAYSSNRYSTLDGYARDLIEILEALNLTQVVFVGHSVSCMIGMKAAIRYPEYFSKLIFVAPSPSYINEPGYPGGLNRADLDALLEVMDSNYLGWASTMAPLIMSNTDTPELAEELNANFCATDPDIAREFARVTFLSDNRPDLPQLTVPSLTLQCTDDILAPLEVGYYMQSNIKENNLTILRATGHCPHLSAPDETIEAIISYLKK